MDKKQKIEAIYSQIGKHRNVGNEYEGDFLIKEVMIGDIFDYIENTELAEFSSDYAFQILNIWKKKRKPLENQSEECIDFITNFLELGNEK